MSMMKVISPYYRKVVSTMRIKKGIRDLGKFPENILSQVFRDRKYVDEILNRETASRCVLNAMMSLSGQKATISTLYYICGESAEKIAKTMQTSTHSVIATIEEINSSLRHPAFLEIMRGRVNDLKQYKTLRNEERNPGSEWFEKPAIEAFDFVRESVDLKYSTAFARLKEIVKKIGPLTFGQLYTIEPVLLLGLKDFGPIVFEVFIKIYARFDYDYLKYQKYTCIDEAIENFKKSSCYKGAKKAYEKDIIAYAKIQEFLHK